METGTRPHATGDAPAAAGREPARTMKPDPRPDGTAPRLPPVHDEEDLPPIEAWTLDDVDSAMASNLPHGLEAFDVDLD